MKRLEPASGRRIALAYIAAPAAALASLSLLFLSAEMWDEATSTGPRNPFGLIHMMPEFLFAGVVACALVEGVVVTPLLLGLRRHRWKWVNTWSLAVTGFAVGFAPFALPELALSRGISAFWEIGRCVPFGIAGVIGALVFRVVGLRKVDPASMSADVF